MPPATSLPRSPVNERSSRLDRRFVCGRSDEGALHRGRTSRKRYEAADGDASRGALATLTSHEGGGANHRISGCRM